MKYFTTDKKGIQNTVYVIDDGQQCMMIWADEYQEDGKSARQYVLIEILSGV